MILKPRPYQEDCISAFEADFGSGIQRAATVLPTGMGKTVIMAHLGHRFIRATSTIGTFGQQVTRRIAIFVHRDELVNQTVDKFHSVDPTLTIGVVKASRHEIDCDVVIISIQTIGRKDGKRLHSIPSDHFGLLIVDECHHAAARSYMEAIRYFGGFSDIFNNDTAEPTITPMTYVAGFTATLQRQDKLGLGDVFQKVVYKKDILFGIRSGFLTNVRGKSVTIDDLDLDTSSGVKVSGGDYSEGSLGEALIESDAGRVIAHAYQEHASDRTGLVFAPTVASAEQISEDLQHAGFTTDVLTGATSLEDRALMFKRVRTGETQILVNCMVATEGFDMPQISCVVIARPTRNQGLFVQMVGRGVRPWKLHDGSSPYPWIRTPKTDCLVLLVNGSGENNKLASIADLSETIIGPVKDGETITDASDREISDEIASGKKVDTSKLKFDDVDLFESSRFEFRRTTKKGYIYIPTKDFLVAIYPEDSSPETTYMVGTVFCGKGPRRKGATYARRCDLGYAMAIAEDVANDLEPEGTVARKSASWKKRKEPASPAQWNFIHGLRREKLIVEMPPADLTKVEASVLIDSAVASSALDGYTPPAPKVEPVEWTEGDAMPCATGSDCGCPVEARRSCPGMADREYEED